MKKTPLLNSALSEVIASLGHGDMLVIGDAGLPIPPQPRRIDLALTKGIPGFVDTLETVLTEMQVERVIVAQETSEVSPHILAAIQHALPDKSVEFVSHQTLKEFSTRARAIVRTGEFTPFANVILVSGVVF
jgi:D-ribose pyranase